jgi:hypothetical protein
VLNRGVSRDRDEIPAIARRRRAAQHHEEGDQGEPDGNDWDQHDDENQK